MKKYCVLSLSGGMDSTSLLIHLLANDYEVIALSFDYNQKHKVELQRASQNTRFLSSCGFPVKHRVIDLKSVFEGSQSALTNSDIQVPEGHYEQSSMVSTVVENRNAIFSSIIFGQALSLSKKVNSNVDICLAIHAGDHAIYPDCRQEFRDAIEHAFKIGNWDSEKVNYYTPYLNENKTTILQDCLKNCEKLGLDFDMIMRNTNTSYNPDSEGRASGKSGADIERIEAFLNIGRKDPVEYQQSWEETVAHAKSVLQLS